MNTPRTIDNLGYDASQRYAMDQKTLQEGDFSIREHRRVFDQTVMEVVNPTFNSECDILFNAGKKNASWAEFSPPNGYGQQKKQFFTYQLFPSLGSHEKGGSPIEALLIEIEDRIQKKEEEGKNQQEDTQEKEEWELVQEKDKKQKEKKIIMQLLHCILHLDKCMIYVTNKRGQYQKG